MKFYFCEACGKRVTEVDIHGGDARDKKLKGVYCSDCAIGVTTMDTLPLSDEEAQKLTSDSASDTERRPAKRPSSGTRPVPRRRSSKARIATATRKPGESDARIPAAGEVGVARYIMVGVALMLVPLALVLILWPSSSAKPKPLKNDEDRVATEQTTVPGPMTEVEAEAVTQSEPGNPLPKKGDSAGPIAEEPEKPASAIFDSKPLPAPQPPSDIALEKSGDDGLALRWQDAEKDIAEYAVERTRVLSKTDAGAKDAEWKEVGRVSGSKTAFDDGGLAGGFTYIYRVRSRRGEQWSAWTEPSGFYLKDPKAETEKAYAAFRRSFVLSLHAGLPEEAASRLAAAKKDTRFALVRDRFAVDEKALDWWARVQESLPKGASKLNAKAPFELKLTDGRKFRIRPKSDFKVVSADKGKLMLSSKGMEMPVAYERLHVATRNQLIELGLPADQMGKTLRAFRACIAAGRGDGKGLARARKAMEPLKGVKASRDDIAYLGEILDIAREVVQERAWQRLENLVQKKEWKEAQIALKSFQTDIGRQNWLGPYRERLAPLIKKVEHGVELLEGMRFDFETEENYKRFLKRFSVVGPKGSAWDLESGEVVATFANKSRSIRQYAPDVSMGRKWLLECRVMMHEPIKLSGGKIVSKGWFCQFRLPFADKTKENRKQLGSYLVEFHRIYNGYIYCGLMAPGQKIPRHGQKPVGMGVFDGMGSVFGGWGGLLTERKVTKAKDPNDLKPLGVDGWYRIRIEMNDTAFKVTLNGKPYYRKKLTTRAAEAIANSPLGFQMQHVYASKSGFRFRLDEFRFKRLDDAETNEDKGK